MLFSEFPFIFKRQLAYKGREKIRYITYLCREKYFLTMRKTINCFIPYMESTAAEQTGNNQEIYDKFLEEVGEAHEDTDNN